jgi:hypothetical protein
LLKENEEADGIFRNISFVEVTNYGIVLIKVSTTICPTLQQNQGAACYTTMTCLEIMVA